MSTGLVLVGALVLAAIGGAFIGHAFGDVTFETLREDSAKSQQRPPLRLVNPDPATTTCPNCGTDLTDYVTV